MTTMHNPPHPGAVLKDGVFDGSTISITDFDRRHNDAYALAA